MAKVTISNFHDYDIGDLAFLAMLIGMNNSERVHCLLCNTNFNKDNESFAQIAPTIPTQQDFLTHFQNDLANSVGKKTKYANFNGVKAHSMMHVNPRRINTPILLCLTGLIDKVLDTYNAWIVLEVEYLPRPADTIRQTYREALRLFKFADIDHINAVTLNQTLQTPILLHRLQFTTEARATAKKAVTTLKGPYNNIITQNHYHGGKFTYTYLIFLLVFLYLIRSTTYVDF